MRKIPPHFFWLLFLISTLPLTIIAQPNILLNQEGYRFIDNYSFRDYNAYSENWAVVQDHRGIMYIGNGQGILEYDGVEWRLLSGESVYSLTISQDSLVYASMYGDFGYLAYTPQGKKQFTSVLNDSTGEYENFLGRVTLAMPDGVYCVSREMLLKWDGQQLQTWKPEEWFGQMFAVQGQLYVSEKTKGLMKMSDRALVPAFRKNYFPEAEVSVMLPYPNVSSRDSILIGTYTNGLFLSSGNVVKPFQSAATEYFKTNQLSTGSLLSNGIYAFGTDRGGMVTMNAAGEPMEILSEETGIRDGGVQALYPDRQGNLWLALYDGIARAELPSNFSFFSENAGIQSDVSVIQRHQDKLYMIGRYGRYRGIYSQETKPLENISGFGSSAKMPQFKPEKAIVTNCWALLSAGQDLLAATDAGIYIINDNGVSHLKSDWIYTQTLHQSSRDSNRVFVGLVDGLAVIERENGVWLDRGKLADTDSEVAHIVEEQDGTLWLETWTGTLWRITDIKNQNFKNPRNIRGKQYDDKDGLPSGFAYVSTINGRAIFPTSAGLRYYDSEKDAFPSDNTFGPAFADTTLEIQYVVEDPQKNVWLYSVKEGQVNIARAVPDNNGGYTVHQTPFNPIAALGDIVYTIYPENDGTTWFGTSEGLIRYNPEIISHNDIDYDAYIRKVSLLNSDSVIYFGDIAPSGNSNSNQPTVTLDYSDNAISFEFAAAYFSNKSDNQYQYILEGFDRKWSDWRKSPVKEHTNIPEGSYVFRVRVRNVYGHISNEAAFAFSILPPWYRSWIAYMIYAFGFILVTLGVSRIRNRQLKARSMVLEKRVHERTQEIRKQAEEIHMQAEELKDKNDELVRTQEKLVVQEKLASLGSLTAGIAHEIKNPLNFVNNFASLSIELVEDLETEMAAIKAGNPSEDAEEYVEELLSDIKMNAGRINEHGKRADNIIKEMLKHSRGVAGESGEVNFNELIEEYLNLTYHGFKAQHPEVSIILQKEFDDDIGKIEVIPQDLSRAVINIVNNSCYAVLEKHQRLGADFKPQVKVTTRKEGKWVELRIHDNGDGIPDDIREKIFNPFFTTKPTGEGTGLGLSLTHDIIVKVHHGEIRLESEKGEFTEFIIRLPR